MRLAEGDRADWLCGGDGCIVEAEGVIADSVPLSLPILVAFTDVCGSEAVFFV